MSAKRIYVSSSGDAWDLVRDEEFGHVSVRHQPNVSSGGKASEIDVGVFLSANAGKAEVVALLEMIGSLVQDESGSINEEPLMKQTEARVVARAKQLFEEEKSLPWDDRFSKRTSTTPPASPGEDEQSAYIERARREAEIEEEGHP